MFKRLGISALLSVGIAMGAQAAPVVDAPAGALEGGTVGSLNVFKGVPFAKPPVGDLRWKAPVEADGWEGARAAHDYGPACIQPDRKIKSIYFDPPEKMSEDCLYLNIWAPENVENAPVFVWIHGGALRAGFSHQSMYDGAKLAEEHGMVVVSINYRLGVLGYMAHPELSAETPDGVSGNYGLLDQIAALEWVRDNISAFGGSPENVTIAGESAGALSVMYLMASPPAHGLFHKAIAQSAYMISTPPLKTPGHGWPAAEAIGVFVANTVKAENIAALREVDPSELTEAAFAAGYAPWGSIDGKYLPHQLVDVFDKGEQAAVPILTGFNEGEIRSLRVLAPPVPSSKQIYTTEIRNRYGDLAGDFLKLYPARELAESILAAPRDALYGWTSERLVRKQTEIGQKGYLYFFDHGYPAADNMGLHAFHAAEIPYVFGTAEKAGEYWPTIPDTKREKRLSKAMMSYWASFARSGTPSAEGEPEWKPYAKAEPYMAFENKPDAKSDLLPGMFELHEETVCRRKAEGTMLWGWNTGIMSPVLPPKTPDCP